MVAAVINFNGWTVLHSCLESIFLQSYPLQEVLVVDNNSTDGSLERLRRYPHPLRLLWNEKNLGFAGGANRAIRETESDYLLLMNPDVILSPTFLERLVSFAEAHPEGGSFGGKLLRFAADKGSEIIDSTGHILYRSRWVVNRGEGEKDEGQFEEAGEVFGVCAAAALYRRVMLEDVRQDEEYLDEDFFLYLEDVDLDWRARLRGWKAYYVPSATARHQRGYGKLWESRNHQVLRHCLRNRYLLLLKNDTVRDLLRDAWAVIPFELLRFFKYLLFSPSSLRGYWDWLPWTGRLLRKRRHIQKGIRITPRERRRWFARSGIGKSMRQRLGAVRFF